MSKSQLTHIQADKSPWERVVRHYVTSLLWLLFVTCFAYLELIVKFALSEDAFFDCYAATQRSWIAVATNASFWAFVVYDYFKIFGLRGHNWAWIFIVISIICVAIMLPILKGYIENGMIYKFRSYSFTFYLGYIPHIIFLISLYVIRSETSRYTISLKDKEYDPVLD